MFWGAVFEGNLLFKLLQNKKSRSKNQSIQLKNGMRQRKKMPIFFPLE